MYLYRYDMLHIALIRMREYGNVRMPLPRLSSLEERRGSV